MELRPGDFYIELIKRARSNESLKITYTTINKCFMGTY